MSGLKTTGWKPGQSGNPGGRPRIVKAFQDANLDPKEIRGEVLTRLVAAMRELDRTSASWRMCVTRLADLLGLKPRQQIDLHVEDPATNATGIDWSRVPLERRREIEAVLRELEALEDVPPDGDSGGVTEH